MGFSPQGLELGGLLTLELEIGNWKLEIGNRDRMGNRD